MNQVIGIGYEGADLESFISRLRLRGVETVVDVRLTPISRKRGFSKAALAEALRNVGVQYVHFPELGNPKDNRDGYGAVQGIDAETARGRFDTQLQQDAASNALGRIVAIAEENTVAILCFESSEDHCHRQQVLREVRERREPAKN